MAVSRDQDELVALIVDVAHLPRNLAPEEGKIGLLQDIHFVGRNVRTHCAAFNPKTWAMPASRSRCSSTARPNSAGPPMSMIVPMSPSRLAMTGSGAAAPGTSAAMASRVGCDMPRGPKMPPMLSNDNAG